MFVLLLAPRGINTVNLIRLSSYLITSSVLRGGTRALKNTIENTELIKEIKLILFVATLLDVDRSVCKAKTQKTTTNTNKQTN